MIKNIDRKHAHLTLDNRIDIQQMLRDGFNFKMIANSLKKDPSTISKEVRKHIFVKESTCTVKDKHGKEIKEICIKLTKPPYVCNACKKRTYCHMEKHLYDGKYAQNEYEKLLKESREGIPLTKESFYEVDKIISEGVRKGQHIYHIVQTNDINVSLSTVYRHLDKGYLSISPLDLPRKVKFKPRNKNNVTYVPNRVRVGRTYDDFLKFIKIHDISNWVEMDTVIGSQGGKVIMTWDFTFCNFMVGFLLDSKTASNVASAFFDIKSSFNENDIAFPDIVPLVLTDNGGEFSNADAIEQNLNGDKETSLFFCRPMKSCDKPYVEKNHTLFRDICPKGTSFDNFTQETVDLIFYHVNSVARKKLNGKTPYELFHFTFGEKITSLFGIKKIPPREVIQSPLLLKK